MMREFEALPARVPNPEQRGSWDRYELFLKKYGSHLVTTAYAGSRDRSSPTKAPRSSWSSS
jgi:hypothetical protein